MRRIFDAIARLLNGIHIPAKGSGGPEVDEGQTEVSTALSAPRAKPQRQRHEPQGVTAGENAIDRAWERAKASRRSEDFADYLTKAGLL